MTFRVPDHVSDFAAGEISAASEPSVQHETRANAAGQHDIDEVLLLAKSQLPVFRDGGAVNIVFQQHRHSHLLFQRGTLQHEAFL